MLIKALLLISLTVFSLAWTESENILSLTDDDLSGIFNEFSHILILFCDPQTDLCKEQTPTYIEVAKELRRQQSIVKVADIDAIKNTKFATKFKVKHYPTYLFFLNGKNVDQFGKKNKDSMINWLLKKGRDPVFQISEERYQQLFSSGLVSVVYHGDFPSAEKSNILKKIAVEDDYTTYYWGNNLGKEQGSVEIIRSFDEPAIYHSIDHGLSSWISKNQRPLVLPFEDRTLFHIFAQQKLGLILFNADNNIDNLKALNEAALEYSKSKKPTIIFTSIPQENPQITEFSSHVKVNYRVNPIIIIDVRSQSKYVMQEQVTKENILTFLAGYRKFRYGLNQQVKKKEEKKVAEQL